jgi:hypothetical protein
VDYINSTYFDGSLVVADKEAMKKGFGNRPPPPDLPKIPFDEKPRKIYMSS